LKDGNKNGIRGDGCGVSNLAKKGAVKPGPIPPEGGLETEGLPGDLGNARMHNGRKVNTKTGSWGEAFRPNKEKGKLNIYAGSPEVRPPILFWGGCGRGCGTRQRSRGGGENDDDGIRVYPLKVWEKRKK